MEELLERLALKQLHGDKRVAVLRVNVVDGADAGVVQRGGGLRLAPEALKGRRIGGNVSGKEFQGDKAAELGVLSPVNDAHSATTDFFHHAVVANRLADEGWLLGHSMSILWGDDMQVNATLARMKRKAKASRRPGVVSNGGSPCWYSKPD